MKFATATAILFAAVALASPAPVAQPEADVAAVAQPVEILAERAPILEDRATKKPKGGSSGGNNSENAADMLTASRVLQLGAVGLGVMEIVRLWG